MQEPTLNKIRRVLNLGESSSQTTYSDLFRYHDDMYHQKPRPGNQIHTKLHDPIHDRLRKNAAAQHYNLTNGERLTSKDGKTYPPREFGESRTNTAQEQAAKLAADHRAKAEEYRKTPVTRFVSQFGDKAGRVRERHISWHSRQADHYEKLAANFTESTNEENSPEYHSSEYHHRVCLAIDHANAGRHRWAMIHQKAAEKHAAAYHSLTLRKIVDPLYTGNSPHIGTMAESADQHRDLGYDTARRLHGGMGGGGMTHKETMTAVKKVLLRTKVPAEREAFYAGAEHYCRKHCVDENGMRTEAKKEDEEEKSTSVFPKARETTTEETGRRRFQVLAGGQDSGSAGTTHDSMDDAWEAAKRLRKHPQYRSSQITIHDRDTGALHGLSGRIIGRLPVRESSDDVDHEEIFWNHIAKAHKAVSVKNARRHSVTALNHAKLHFEKTGKKIDAEGILDGLPSGHEHYLKY